MKKEKASANIFGLSHLEDFEDLQKARKDLIGELDAILGYDYHIHESYNDVAIATWEDIRDEELVHVGELLGLLFYLAPYQETLVNQGMREFQKRLEEMEY